MSKTRLCCVPGNVRYCILFLTIASTSVLFANLILFSVAVLYQEEQPNCETDRFRFFGKTIIETSTNAGTGLPTTPGGRRFVREVDVHSSVNETYDIVHANESATEILVSESRDSGSIAHNTTEIPHDETMTAEDTTTIRLLSRADEIETDPAQTTPATEETTVRMVKLGEGVWVDKDLRDEDKDSDGTPVQIAGIPHITLAERVHYFLTWAAPGLGILLGTFPVIYILRSFGERKFFAGLLLLSALATAALALAPHIKHGGFLTAVCRFVQGFAFASVFPVIGSMTANWATLKQQFFFLVCCTFFIQVAPLISWPLSTLLFVLSYKLPFLIQSSLTITLSVIWYICYREKPQYHPVVNGLELNKIVAGKIKAENNRVLAEAPFKVLVSSFPVWAIWISVFGYFIVISTAVQFLPTYCYTVAHGVQQSSALVATLPFMFMFVITSLHGLWYFLASFCADRVSVLVYNTASFIVCSLIFIILAIFPPGERFTYSIAAPFTLILCCLALSMHGFYRSATLVGRFFAQFIVSYMQIAAGLAFTVTAAAVTFLIRENTAHEWRVVFLLQAVLLLICVVVFGVFGSAAPEEWSKDSWDPSAARPMISFDQIDYHNDECGLLEMRVLR